MRNLYATGFFTNLAIKDEPLGDGVRVNVVVEPKPLVKDIVIKGASKIKTTRVKKEIKSKVGESLSEQQISADADKIKDLYLGKGYNQVQVSYHIDTQRRVWPLGGHLQHQRGRPRLRHRSRFRG